MGRGVAWGWNKLVVTAGMHGGGLSRQFRSSVTRLPLSTAKGLRNECMQYTRHLATQREILLRYAYTVRRPQPTVLTEASVCNRLLGRRNAL